MASDKDKTEAAMAVGFLEGVGLWVWSHVKPDSADSLAMEDAEAYDKAVETLRKAVLEDD